jgi:hypothetical protein
MSNRYDSLREKIARDFARGKTYTPAISDGNGTETVFSLHDVEATGNDRFLKYGPFNYVRIQNFSGSPVRVYLNRDLSLYTEVPGASGRGKKANRNITAEIPLEYVSYLRVENIASSSDGSGDIAEGELMIQVGNKVTSAELDLLKMGGQLDVQG